MRKTYELKINDQEVRVSADGPLKAGKNFAPHILVTAACNGTIRQGTMTLAAEHQNYTKEKFIEELNRFVERIAAEAERHDRSHRMIEEHLAS